MNGFQKEGGNFLNLLQKEGAPSEMGEGEGGGGGSNPGGNYGKSYIKNYINFPLCGHKLSFSISNI